MKKRFFNVRQTIFTVITLPILIYSLFSLIFSFSCLIRWVDFVLYFLTFVSLIAWLVVIVNYFCKSERVRGWLAVATVVLAVIFVFTIAPFSMFVIVTSSRVRMTSYSPDGENKLVVLEGGYLDATYNAYPVKFKWFYQRQNNGSVSNRDDWGGSEIEIEWISNDKAVVRILSGANSQNGNSNAGNEIIVTFD